MWCVFNLSNKFAMFRAVLKFCTVASLLSYIYIYFGTVWILSLFSIHTK